MQKVKIAILTESPWIYTGMIRMMDDDVSTVEYVVFDVTQHEYPLIQKLQGYEFQAVQVDHTVYFNSKVNKIYYYIKQRIRK